MVDRGIASKSRKTDNKQSSGTGSFTGIKLHNKSPSPTSEYIMQHDLFSVVLYCRICHKYDCHAHGNNSDLKQVSMRIIT